MSIGPSGVDNEKYVWDLGVASWSLGGEGMMA